MCIKTVSFIVLSIYTEFFRQSRIRVKEAIRPVLIARFCSMKRLDSYSPLDGMLVHRRVTPNIKFAGTHLYTWVERSTVRVRCLDQEHNTMSPAGARTRTARMHLLRATLIKRKQLLNYVNKTFFLDCRFLLSCFFPRGISFQSHNNHLG